MPLHLFGCRLWHQIDCPVNMPDPIHIQSGLAQEHWPEVGQIILAHWLAFTLDLFGQHQQLARTKSDPAWFCTIWSGPSVEECNRVWKWETGSGLVTFCQKPGSMAKTWPGYPDRIRVGFAQYGPGFLWKNRTESDAETRIWPIKYDLAYKIWSGPILAARWL